MRGATEADLLEGIKAGANASLPLPFTFAEVLAGLRACLGRKGG
jgi:DNA-binding response OmpR family regulator